MIKKTVFFLLGLSVSGLCLWYVLSKQDLGELIQEAKSLRWFWLLPNLIIFYLAMYLRAVRWALFFPPESEVRGRSIFGPMMMGYTLNSLFPGRLGEIGRAVLVGRREKTNFPTTLATVAAERVVDMLTILAGLVLVLVFVEIDPEISESFGGFELNAEILRGAADYAAVMVGILIAGIALVMLKGFRRLVSRILHALPLIPESLAQLADRLMESVAAGFSSLKDPKRIAWIALWSVLIWGMTGWSVDVLASAFGIPMTFLQGFAITVLLCFAIMIPAAPGYWGLYELGFIFSAHVLALEASEASIVAMAILLHLTQYVPVILIGFAWAGLSGSSLMETARAAKSEGKHGQEAEEGAESPSD